MSLHVLTCASDHDAIVYPAFVVSAPCPMCKLLRGVDELAKANRELADRLRDMANDVESARAPS